MVCVFPCHLSHFLFPIYNYFSHNLTFCHPLCSAPHSFLYSPLSHFHHTKMQSNKYVIKHRRDVIHVMFTSFPPCMTLLVPNSQNQWLNSLTPRIAPLSACNNIPWLVYMAEACQGIILSRWWIYSIDSHQFQM